MCSIFGAVLTRPLSVTQRVRLQSLVDCLALAGASRGTDATGIGVVWPGMQYHIVKDAVKSYDMVRRASWKEALTNRADTPLAILGHTRAKTHGANTMENAHPFAFEQDNKLKILGTHNGVISNFTAFGSGKYDVDSQSLFEGLCSTNTAKEIGEKLYLATGSYALAFTHNDRFYLARNPSSPCYFTELPGLYAYVYASTEHMIRTAAAIAGERIGKIKSARPGRLYGFNWAKNRWSTNIYETFSAESGISIGPGKVDAKKGVTITKNIISITEDYKEEVTTYSDGTVVTIRCYKCPACGVLKDECRGKYSTCRKCLERSTGSTNVNIKEAPLTAFDRPESITEERIVNLLKLLEEGAFVPCTACNNLYSAPFMQRSTMINGVLCNACESNKFAMWWHKSCQERGGTYCTVCKEQVKSVKIKLKPKLHMMCGACEIAADAKES